MKSCYWERRTRAGRPGFPRALPGPHGRMSAAPEAERGGFRREEPGRHPARALQGHSLGSTKEEGRAVSRTPCSGTATEGGKGRGGGRVGVGRPWLRLFQPGPLPSEAPRFPFRLRPPPSRPEGPRRGAGPQRRAGGRSPARTPTSSDTALPGSRGGQIPAAAQR